MVLIGVVLRRSLLQVTSTRLPHPVTLILSDVFVHGTPEDRLLNLLSRMLELDQWYAPIVSGSRNLYRGVLGLEHVIENILSYDAEVLEREVKDYMTSDVIAVNYKQSTYSAWQLMLSQNIAALPVVNDKGVLVGVIAEYDLLRYGYSRPRLESDNWLARSPPIREVMSTPAVVLSEDSSLREAAELMVSRNIGRVYVVDDQKKLLGVVDREDIVRTYVRLKGYKI